MAEYCGFFDGDNLYGQDEFNRYFENLYENGVSIDNNGNMTMKTYVSGNSVYFGAGFAIIKGFYLYSDKDKAITITRDSNYKRIDRAIVQLDLTNKKVGLNYKLGTPSSNPQPPELQRDNLIYELSLSQVHVPVSGSITIVDERARNELCGAIRPKNITEYKDMIKTFTNQFDKWFDSQQSKGWRNVYIQSEQPKDSVVGSIWIKELV